MKVKKISFQAFNNIITLEQALDLAIQKWYNLSHYNRKKDDECSYNQSCGLCKFCKSCQDCIITCGTDSDYEKWSNAIPDSEERIKCALKSIQVTIKNKKKLKKAKEKMLKLTKNEFRYSTHVKPRVGQTVEFMPVVILNGPPHWITKPISTPLIRDYMISGAKCKVIKLSKYITIVHFLDDEDNNNYDLVSSEFLMSRDLTDKAYSALQCLRKKVNKLN